MGWGEVGYSSSTSTSTAVLLYDTIDQSKHGLSLTGDGLLLGETQEGDRINEQQMNYGSIWIRPKRESSERYSSSTIMTRPPRSIPSLSLDHILSVLAVCICMYDMILLSAVRTGIHFPVQTSSAWVHGCMDARLSHAPTESNRTTHDMICNINIWYDAYLRFRALYSSIIIVDMMQR